MEGIIVEMLQTEGMSIIDRLLRIFNRCIEPGVALEDGKTTCIILLHKGKCKRKNCKL